MAERSLGQPLRGVEGTYDRHDYFKERRAALAQRTALLLETERGDRKVTAIGQRSEQRKAGDPAAERTEPAVAQVSGAAAWHPSSPG